MADKDDDLYESVSGMADRLNLTGRERDRYIHGSMTRGGYKAVPQYVRAEDDDDDDDDDFFGSGGKRRRSDAGRSRGKGSGRTRSRDDDDDW